MILEFLLLALNTTTSTVTSTVSSTTTSAVTGALHIPDSTILVMATALSTSLVTQLATHFIVDLNAERRMKAELNRHRQEKLAATKANDKEKLEKLKKKDLQMQQMNMKVSSARFKVTIITFVPILVVYYLMAGYLGGFGVVVALSPVPIPLLVDPATEHVVLFWWYFLASFLFANILSRLLHTTT